MVNVTIIILVRVNIFNYGHNDNIKIMLRINSLVPI